MLAPINLSLDPKLDWPTRIDIIDAQKKTKDKETDDVQVDQRNRLWISNDDNILNLRILIAAHTGFAGHRGKSVTLAALQAHFWWAKIEDDNSQCVRSCLHCLASSPGVTIPRPLGHAMHSNKCNELIHFHFCFMTPGRDGYKYGLILKDDFSGYVRVKPAKETTAEVTALHLMSWFASLEVVEQWVSDRGSQLQNELIKELKDKLKSSHHFTLAYFPWANGTVEVVCRELICATRAVSSAFQFQHKAWPSILPVVQSVLNISIPDLLGNRCPLTTFTNLPQSTPLLTIKRKAGKKLKVKTIEEVRAKQKCNLENLSCTESDARGSSWANKC